MELGSRGAGTFVTQATTLRPWAWTSWCSSPQFGQLSFAKTSTARNVTPGSPRTACSRRFSPRIDTSRNLTALIAGRLLGTGLSPRFPQAEHRVHAFLTTVSPFENNQLLTLPSPAKRPLFTAHNSLPDGYICPPGFSISSF